VPKWNQNITALERRVNFYTPRPTSANQCDRRLEGMNDKQALLEIARPKQTAAVTSYEAAQLQWIIANHYR